MAENQGTTGGGQAGGTGRPGGGERGPRGGERGGRGRGGPGGRREGGGGRRFFRRRKVCKFCVDKIDHIDYKEVKLIGQFINERGKILPRRVTGVCTPHQRGLKVAVKRARNIALLPFQARI
jgi:small subunit ribosomal protein S18